MVRVTLSLILALASLSACNSETGPYNSPIDSHGLGLSRKAWEIAYGPVKWEDSGQLLFRVATREYMVWFWDGNAGIIDFKNNDGSAMSLESGRHESQGLIPLDSRLLGSQPDGEGVADEYYSESLKSRFSEASWRSGLPGHFQVSYRLDRGNVQSFVIQVGQPISALKELKPAAR